MSDTTGRHIKQGPPLEKTALHDLESARHNMKIWKSTHPVDSLEEDDHRISNISDSDTQCKVRTK
jgi:hypothetical protein